MASQQHNLPMHITQPAHAIVVGLCLSGSTNDTTECTESLEAAGFQFIQDEAVVDLFCALAENSPELLPGHWATLFDVIASEERFWCYPKATVAQIEEESAEAFVPFLNRKRLAAEWTALLKHTHMVHECRASGQRHNFEC